MKTRIYRTDTLARTRRFFIVIIFFLTTLISSLPGKLFGVMVEAVSVPMNITADAASKPVTIITDKQFAEMLKGNWESKFKLESVYNSIELRIDQNQVAAMKQNLDLEVKVEITSWKWVVNKFIQEVKTEVLRVYYKADKTALVQDKDIFRFAGGNRLEFVVKEVKLNSTPVPAGFPTNIYLTSRIETEVYNNLNMSVRPAGLSHSFLSDKGELKVQWATIAGAESYDLEWTFINNYNEKNNSFLTVSEVNLTPYYFKYNSTRVNIKSNSYQIPLLYESGFILYRVRANGRTFSTGYIKEMPGPWSVDDNTEVINVGAWGSQVYTITAKGHQPNINWQNTTTYAEDGKRKEVVTYADGSLRTRQVVTKNNTENKTIVGETIYDHVGRPAINVLPVPVEDAKIKFNNDFNLAPNSTSAVKIPYDIDHFENEASANGSFKASPMSTLSGASNYYSPANANKTGHQEYLPDANGYPFSQIEYTPDNTGRIKREGGVGNTHQLNSGHETKYFYGIPDQEELDRLFGSEVGFAKHYKKEVKVDANGQVYVSYINQSGQVIATALAGNNPENLYKLESNLSENLTVDLLNKRNNADRLGQNNIIEREVDGASMSLHKDHIVTSPGKITSNYEVNVPPFSTDICEGKTFTAPVTMDLNISMKDDCGTEILTDQQAGGIINKTITPGAAGTLQYKSTLTTPDKLNVGSYSLDKKVSINKDKLDEHTNAYLKRLEEENCVNLNKLIELERSLISESSCETSCEECITEINNEFPTPPDFGTDLYPVYLERMMECDGACQNQIIPCVNAYKAMLDDMAPHGQYGLVMDNSSYSSKNERGEITIHTPALSNIQNLSLINPYVDKLSIFNDKNSLPRYKAHKTDDLLWKITTSHRTKVPHYKEPVNWRGESDYYRSKEGGVDFVYLQEVPTLDASGNIVVQYYPEIESTSIVKENPNGKYVYPHELTLKSFISNWRPSWARSLIYYHPEFPIFVQCMSQKKSYEFEADFKNTETRQEAFDKGYLKSDGTTNLDADPFFNKNLNLPFFSVSFTTINQEKYREWMQAKINNFNKLGYTLWETAYMFEYCPPATKGLTCPPDPTCPKGKTVSDDKVWERYRSLYISLRQEYIEDYQKVVSVLTGAFNGCIGNERFDGMNVSHYVTIDNEAGTGKRGYLLSENYRFFNSDKVCGSDNYELYKNKTPRFATKDYTFKEETGAGQFCFDYNSNNIIEDGECISIVNEALENASSLYYIKAFEECGQCPLAKDLENFFNEIVHFDGVDLNTSFDFGCTSTSKINAATERMLTALNFNNLTGPLRWEVVSETNTGLNAKIRSGSEECLFTFSYPVVDADNLPVISFDIKEIKQIYRLLPKPAVAGDPNPGKSFYFQAKYLDRNKLAGMDPVHLMMLYMTGQIANYYSDVQIEVTNTCMRIDQCDFKPLCRPTGNGYLMQSFLNTLAFKFGGVSNLVRENINISAQPYLPFIQTMQKEWPIDKDDTWKWSGKEQANIFTGTFVSSSNTAFTITLDKGTESFTFSQIERFGNIRANKSFNDNNHFLIDVIIKNGAGPYVLKTISGVFTLMPLVDCTSRVNIAK